MTKRKHAKVQIEHILFEGELINCDYSWDPGARRLFVSRLVIDDAVLTAVDSKPKDKEMTDDKIEFEAEVSTITHEMSAMSPKSSHAPCHGSHVILDTAATVGSSLMGHRFKVTLEPVEPELKPCPFCGESALLECDRAGRRQVRCTGCSIGKTTFGTRKDVVKAWNRRVVFESYSTIRKMVEELYDTFFSEDDDDDNTQERSNSDSV